MTILAVETEQLGKRYRLGVGGHPGYRTIRDSIASLWSERKVKREERGELWALKDVALRIPEGEAVGIIGKNGAGKSTLLKVLSRITEPTTGLVRLRGRVASLLEVGTGFHPELTGRENVYLNGAILGMGRREIQRRFDEIVAFSGVEGFLDTPVKRYSSGMYVRLAFAVAAHLDSEILIVDEVLAVGDSEFQKKCLGRMGSVAQSGRTVIFVSHSMAAISRLCSRAIWLREGQLAGEGPPRDVISAYIGSNETAREWWAPEEEQKGAFRYERVSIASCGPRLGSELAADRPFEVNFVFAVVESLPPGRLALLITNSEGVIVLTSSSTDLENALEEPWKEGEFEMRCRVPAHLLSPGRYTLTFSEPDGRGGNRIHQDALSFVVSRIGSLVERDARAGVVAPMLTWDKARKS